MYSLYEYNNMLSPKNAPRVDAYRLALARLIRPESTVVELGAGLGIFSFAAAQLGAAKVYAIEASGYIELAREMACEAGFGERIEFIEGDSRDIELPERVDILVADLRGGTTFYRSALASIIDGRKRFLKPDASLILEKDIFYGALISDETFYQSFCSGWRGVDGLVDMRKLCERTLNSIVKYRSDKGTLLSAPQKFGEVDYRSIESPDVKFEAELTAATDGVAHGFLFWFDAVVLEDIGFSNAPKESELVYGQMFIPFIHPLKLSRDERVILSLRADLIDERYVFTWETKRVGREAEGFRQSTFFSEPISKKLLEKGRTLGLETS